MAFITITRPRLNLMKNPMINRNTPVRATWHTAAVAVFLFAASLCAASAHGQDILYADFEQDTYVWLPTGGSWVTTGTAFGYSPVRGASISGYLGSGLVKSDEGGYGTLESPPFIITRKYIRFLVGAGNWRPIDPRGHTSINLLVDGAVVRTAVGMGDREDLDWLQ